MRWRQREAIACEAARVWNRSPELQAKNPDLALFQRLAVMDAEKILYSDWRGRPVEKDVELIAAIDTLRPVFGDPRSVLALA